MNEMIILNCCLKFLHQIFQRFPLTGNGTKVTPTPTNPEKPQSEGVLTSHTHNSELESTRSNTAEQMHAKVHIL